MRSPFYAMTPGRIAFVAAWLVLAPAGALMASRPARSRLHRARLRLPAARVSPPANAEALVATPATIERMVDLRPTLLQAHAERVQSVLFLFKTDGEPPPPTPDLTTFRPPTGALLSPQREVFLLMPPAEALFETARARERMLMFRPLRVDSTSDALGVLLFTASTLFAARAPSPIRRFQRKVHLGPAIFDGGGLGVAVGRAL